LPYEGRDNKGKPPMIKVLILPYAAVSVCFLRAYRQKLTVSGVLASLLWPFSLALTLAWLIMLDDDALNV
jgi:p-aminobenzoyl-glutamate transporter AbgT